MRKASFLIRAAAALLLAAPGACAGLRDGRDAYLAPSVPFRTPTPAELGRYVAAEQLITVHRGDSVFVIRGHLSVSPEGLTLIALDPLGRRAFSVTATEAAVHSELAPWLPDSLRPENILADVAIVYWPAAAVRRGLHGSTAILHADERGRSITVDGRELVRVDYEVSYEAAWGSSVRYRNNAFGYELTLRSAPNDR